jgi:hypothetical protein
MLEGMTANRLNGVVTSGISGVEMSGTTATVLLVVVSPNRRMRRL